MNKSFKIYIYVIYICGINQFLFYITCKYFPHIRNCLTWGKQIIRCVVSFRNYTYWGTCFQSLTATQGYMNILQHTTCILFQFTYMYDNFISWSITQEFTCFTIKRTRKTIANIIQMASLYRPRKICTFQPIWGACLNIYCAELPNNINISAYQR